MSCQGKPEYIAVLPRSVEYHSHPNKSAMPTRRFRLRHLARLAPFAVCGAATVLITLYSAVEQGTAHKLGNGLGLLQPYARFDPL